jgi:MFS transporter, PPP family, 3-phenylpropionic acid transporter
VPSGEPAVPYWRLSGFYLFYFAALGALVPYWGLYLKSVGFSAQAIGELMSLIMVTRIVAPNIWGWIADRSGSRMLIVRLASLLAALAFAGVFRGQSYAWLALVMSAFSFFWNAALPQFEAVTLNYLGSEVHRYGRVRLWGSIGFILAVTGLGVALQHLDAGVLLPALSGLFAGIWVMSLLVPERRGRPVARSHVSLAQVLRRPDVLGFLAVCFLMQASHGPYYTFYSIYLDVHGYSRTEIGELWALGVVAEIGVFLVMHRLLLAWGARRVLLVSLALAALRWLLIGWCVDRPGIVLLAQTLHAASFGTYHAAAMYLVHQFFVGRHQGRGQALYSSLSFGAGGAVGGLYSGYTWAGAGPQWTYTCAALLSLCAWLLAWRLIRMPGAECVTAADTPRG